MNSSQLWISLARSGCVTVLELVLHAMHQRLFIIAHCVYLTDIVDLQGIPCQTILEVGACLLMLE